MNTFTLFRHGRSLRSIVAFMATTSLALAGTPGCSLESYADDAVAASSALISAPACDGCELYATAFVAEDGQRFRSERWIDSAGDVHETIYGPDGVAIGPSEFVARIAAARRARLLERGAMTPDLARHASTMSAGDRVLVRGWLTYEERAEDRVARLTGAVDPAADWNRDHLERQASELSAAVRRAVDIDSLNVVLGTPLFTAEVGPMALDALARSPYVQLLERDPGPGEPTGTVWKEAVGADVSNAAGWDGTGVKVAVLEGDRPDITTGLGIVATASPTGAAGNHARYVAGAIREGVFPYGIADSTSILIANWDQYTGPPANVDLWAIGQGAKVINFSWTFNAGGNGGLSTIDLYHDYLALRNPLVIYTACAGNKGADADLALRYVQNRSYNNLIVGATYDQGTATRSDDVIASFSSYRNHTTTHGDRELPEVVAPGMYLTITGDLVSGTSISAPVVAGTLASMLEANSNLGAWPEAEKAIVMATANCNRDGVVLNLTDATDDKDGAGLLNDALAVTLSSNSNYRTSGSAATVRGHAYGYMNFTTDFSGTVFSQSFNVVTDAGGKLSAMLTWDATSACTNSGDPSTCTGAGPDADLNLYLFRASDNALIATSASYDNNYEALIGRTLSANTAYRLEIRKASTRTSTTYYALAWDSFTAGCPDP